MFADLSAFWVRSRDGVVPPSRHEIIKNGSVEVRWYRYYEGDERRNTHLAAMMDWARDNDLKVEWRPRERVENWKFIARTNYAGKVPPKVLIVTIPKGVQCPS